MSNPAYIPTNREILNNIVTQYGISISNTCVNQGEEYNALWVATYTSSSYGGAVIGTGTGRTKDLAREAAAGYAVTWLRRNLNGSG